MYVCVVLCVVCRYLRFKPTAAGAVTWVSPSLQSIDAFTGSMMAGEEGEHVQADRHTHLHAYMF